MRTTALTVAALLALTACGEKDPKPSDTADPTGPGTTPPTTDTEPTYESGCIDADGTGFAYLQDAVDAASDGATITLCGNLDEAVVVSGKAVTIVGNGAASTTWSGPTNTVPLTVQNGGSATVRDLTFASTRSGVMVTGGYLSLTDVHIPAAGGYGIESIEGTVDATRVEITDPPWGGVRMTGGALTFADGLIDGGTTAGILGEDGAELAVTGSVIQNTDFVDDGSGSIADGFGISAIGGSSLTTSNNTLLNNILCAIYVEDSTADLSGDIAGVDAGGLQYLGLYFNNAEVTGTGLDISGAYQWTVYSFSTTLELANTSLVADPALSLPSSFGSTGSMGLVQVDGQATLTNSSVSGHNSAGLWVESTAGDATLITNGVVVDDNWERGIFASEATVEAVDTVISNTHNNDPSCVDPKTGSMSCNMAMFAISSTTSFTGGEVIDNEGWGLAGLEANVTADGVSFSGNDFVSVFVQAANVSVLNSTFSGWGNFGVYLNDSSGLITGSTFVDRNYDDQIVDWDGAGGYADYHYQAIDIYGYSADLTLEDTVFENTQYGVYMSDTALVANDVSFDGTNQPFLLYSGTDYEIEGLYATGTGSTVVDCSTGAVSVKDATIEDTVPYTYSYEYYYADGSLAFSTLGAGSTAAIDGYACDMTIEDTEILNSEAEGVYGYDCSVEIDDLTVRNPGNYIYTTAAIELYNYNVASDAEITSVELTGVRYGSGIYIYNGSKTPGNVSIAGAEIGLPSFDGYSGVEKHAVYVYGAIVTVDGLDTAGNGYSAIYASNSPSLTITGASGSSTGLIDQSANYGVELWNSTVTLDALTIDTPGLSGIYAQNTVLTTSGVTVSGASMYGIDCQGSTTFDTCDATLDGAMGALGPFCPVCE